MLCKKCRYVEGKALMCPSARVQRRSGSDGWWWNIGFGGFGKKTHWCCFELVVVDNTMRDSGSKVGRRRMRWLRHLGSFEAVKERMSIITQTSKRINCERK
jgi:hypothetical protein